MRNNPTSDMRLSDMGHPALLGFWAELKEEGFCGGLCVEDVLRGEPGAAELGDAVAHLVQFFGGMGVGVDYYFAAVLFGEAEMQVVEIGASGGCVVLDGYA